MADGTAADTANVTNIAVGNTETASRTTSTPPTVNSFNTSNLSQAQTQTRAAWPFAEKVPGKSIWTALTTPRVYSEPPDGGLAAWSIVVCAMFVHIVTVGFVYVPGIFATYWLSDSDFEEPSKTAVSWVMAVFYGSYQGTGIIAGKIVNKYGTRTCIIAGGCISATGLFLSSFVNSLFGLYVTFGALVGAGCCLGFMPSVFLVQRYFKRNRSTATGLAVMGTGIGGLILGPVVQSLIANYGWRGAARLLCTMWLTVLPIVALPLIPVVLQPGVSSAAPSASLVASNAAAQASWDERAVNETDCNNSEKHVNVDDTEQTTVSVPVTSPQEKPAQTTALPRQSLREMLRNKRFLLWVFGTALYGGAWYVILSHFNTFVVVECGFDPAAAAGLVSVQGIANLVGRLVLGVTSDRSTKLSKPVFIAGCISAIGIFTAGLPFFGSHYAYLVIYMLVNGFGGGAVVSMQAPVTVSLVGLASLPLGQGMVQSGQSPFVVLGPVVAGGIKDVSGSYLIVWLGCAAMIAVAAYFIAFEVEPHRRPCCRQRPSPHDTAASLPPQE